ncbi:MAG: ATP-binding protein [Bdellovibrionota bacterium]
MKLNQKKPRRSLRTVLVVWFLLFSIVPLGFVTWYSLSKYEVAIDKELSLRLSGNSREIAIILSDFRVGLQQRKEKYLRDPHFIYNISTNDAGALRAQMSDWVRNEFSASLTLYNREARLMLSVFKDEKGEVRNFVPIQDAVFLTDKLLGGLKAKKEVGVIRYDENQKMSLLSISKITNTNGKTIGYLEQALDLDKYFLNRLRARLKLELMLLKETGQVVAASSPDLLNFNKEFFKKYLVDNPRENLFEIQLRNTPYGFVINPADWGDSRFYVALGASKADAKSVLKNIKFAFVTIVGAVVILLVITILVSSSWFLKPINELVDALQSFESQEQAVTISVKNDTEIGLLTESFNQMSLKISQARTDLRKKISELESSNKELTETQTKLIHSAKMVSLGQLVAGVAHELNNPISFIYSNMIHLKDYAEKLMQLIEMAESDPAKLKKFKEEFEYSYIKEDLPKLVASCQEGARRTRDIVLGLRNFSRLEEAKLKEIDIIESLETTLDLLQGEIKNRIQVHKNYEPIPRINGYATQINQVFMNILSNALQSIEGNGSIWISTVSIKDVKTKTTMVKISLQDSGKGIPSQVLDKIFDPFFTTKEVGQGTGLGLSITYGIIHNHGGDIQVRSEVGVGTEFVVLLPVQPPTITSLT